LEHFFQTFSSLNIILNGKKVREICFELYSHWQKCKFKLLMPKGTLNIPSRFFFVKNLVAENF
jgi:hypothetical protein